MLLRRIINLFRPVKVTKADIYTLTADQRLQGKRIVVTGGTGAIGQAMAKRFVAEGAKVLITGRNEEKLRQLALEL